MTRGGMLIARACFAFRVICLLFLAQGDTHVALQARLMSQAMRKLTSSVARTNCLLIFINQIRHKVGVLFGSPETTPGGNALKFYASVRLDIRRSGGMGPFFFFAFYLLLFATTFRLRARTHARALHARTTFGIMPGPLRGPPSAFRACRFGGSSCRHHT